METEMRTRQTGLQECESNECLLPEKHEGVCDDLPPVSILYTNWKGRQAKRKVSPTGQMVHEVTEFHKVPGWLVEVIDHEDGKTKRFSFKDVNGGRETLVQAICLRWWTRG
jgi:hypothetical protein